MSGIESGTILFERYKIKRVLGKGGFGTVYLAENLKVGNLVAIKVVPEDEKDMSLVAEKDLLKELRHPAIPMIIDIETSQGAIYLIEEYVEGVSLKELKHKLKEDEVIEIMKQLIDVLTYLHTSFAEPIIYRDMKPDNIIRMQGGHIKLVDFGIAKKYKRHQENDTVQLGSRGYAAPEQYGVGKTDVRTDIYSLGICMYYLLTGKNLGIPPYKLNTLRSENGDVSVSFEKIIHRCIASVPRQRYQTVLELDKALESLNDREFAHRDRDVFSDHSKEIVRCIGIKSGIGTTHMAVMVAVYHQALGKRVALVEYHRSEDFTRISLIHSDIQEYRHYFSLEGIDYYPFYHYGGYHKIFHEAYDLVVLDSGVMEADRLESEKAGMSTMLICGGKDWEIDSFEDYYFENPNRNFHYCFNLTEESRYMRLRSGIDGLKCYRVPLNPDPYKQDKTTRTMFDRITCEAVLKPERLEGKMDDIRAYIKETLKKYQKA